jgi:hypothetical protein
VIEAVQNSWVVKYIPKRNAQTKSIEMTTIKYSHIPSKMGMMPNEVIPFLTRYITKMIRGKNPRSAGDVISQRLKATPVNQGALRNVVFHALQRHYPQMSLSSKANDVYVVAEFHKTALDTIYLDSQQDVNQFLTIDAIGTQFPRLKRLVGPVALLKGLISHLNAEPQLKGLLPLTLVVTDPFHEGIVKDMLSMLKDYPLFFQSVHGVGFVGDPTNPKDPGPFYSESLKNLLTSRVDWAPKILEVDPILIGEEDLDGLLSFKNLGLKIQSNSLEQAYYKLLPQIETYLRGESISQSCLRDLDPLAKEAFLTKQESLYFLNYGFSVEFSDATMAGLILAPH